MRRPQLAKKQKFIEKKFPKLIVNYENRQQLIHRIGSVKPDKKWDQIKDLIYKKFGLNQKYSLQYLYELQDDLSQILIQKDYQNYCQFVKQNKQTPLMVLNEPQIYVQQQEKNPQKIMWSKQQQKVSIKQFGLMDFGKTLFSTMFAPPTKSNENNKKKIDANQEGKTNSLIQIAGNAMMNYLKNENNKNNLKKDKMKMSEPQQKQKNHGKKQDIFWLTCRLCKEKKRQNKYICILCQKNEEVYCYDCHSKRKNPNHHILKEIQMGNQKQIAFLRDCFEKQLQSLKKPFLKFQEPNEKCQIFLKEDFQKLCLNYQVTQKQRIIIPNLMNLGKSNPQTLLKRTCNINSILKMKDLQTAKKDFLEFLQKKQNLNNLQIENIKDELEKQKSMLKLYSKSPFIYRNANMSLKEPEIGKYPERLSYTRYPIHLLYHQTQEHYMNQIKNGNRKYLKQFKVFRGGVISKKQYERLKIDEYIQILSFMSTSFQLQVANDQNFKQNLLFTIIKPQNKGFQAQQGFCILNEHGQSQKYDYEEEVLFNVYSKFRVLKKFYNQQLKLYEVTLEYLQIPENINNQNIDKISSTFNIQKNGILMANLQHLQLINRGQMNQGKCFKNLSNFQKAKLFYYYKKNYLIKQLKQIQAAQNLKQSKKMSEKQFQLITNLAKVFNELGQLFKTTGQYNIYKIYAEKSMIMINYLSSQEKVSKELQQINAQIRFNYYTSLFEWQQILNLKKLALFKGNYHNSKSRRKVIKICNQISKTAGKAKSQRDFSDKIFDEMAELMSQMKSISSQTDKQMYEYILKGIKFFKTFSHQSNKDSKLNQKNYKKSNFLIKFSNLLFSIAKFNCESQLGQLCHWIEIEQAVTNLTNCLEVFLNNRKKYLFQITKICSILSIYYLQDQNQIKSKEYLELSKKILKENLCQKNYLASDLKDIQAYIVFNKGLKLQSQNDIKLCKQLCEQSYKMKKQLWGKQHLSLCVPLNNLAIYYTNQKNYEQAQTKFKQALQICQKNQSFDKKNLYVILTNLAYVYSLNGQKENGKKYMEESLKIQAQIFQTNNIGYSKEQLMEQQQKIQHQDAGLLEMISKLASQKVFQFLIENLTIESHQRLTLEAYMNS